MVNTGSWLGLPDFGITEGLAGMFSNNQTTDLSDAMRGARSSGQEYLQTGNKEVFSDPSQFTAAPKSQVQIIPQSNKTPSTTTTTPTTPAQNTGVQSSSGGINQGNLVSMFPGYAGWDSAAAWADYLATGGVGKGGQGGQGGQDLNAQLRGEIESGYNNYFDQLNGLMGGLGTQGQAQENIANNSYQQSISDLMANKQSNLGDLQTSERKLGENQVKNLRDISSNLQNQYMAGNVMLGARGAGDSSAANQYSYALNRVGSKARGDVMNQTSSSMADIEGQKAKLNNIVTQETSRLDTELANTKQSISSWLAEQQNSIKQMIATGQLNKSKDIAGLTQNALNQAMSAFQTKQQEISNRRSSLESWAMSNANNIASLTQNMQAIGQFTPNMPTAQSINGGVNMDAQGNMRGLFGYGTSNDENLRKQLGY